MKACGRGTFDSNRAYFKHGFSGPEGDYWIGNDRLSQLTAGGLYKVRFDLQAKSTGLWSWIEFGTFIVGDEASGYLLSVGDVNADSTATDDKYSGLVARSNGTKFTTRDQDNDDYSFGNCASTNGAWWHSSCGQPVNGKAPFFRWWYLPGYEYNLLKTKITILLK